VLIGPRDMPGLMASPGSDLIDTNKQIARTTAVRPRLLARSVTGRRWLTEHKTHTHRGRRKRYPAEGDVRLADARIESPWRTSMRPPVLEL